MTTQIPIALLGVPVDIGARRNGCLMGPDAMRTAGMEKALIELGHPVEDKGNIRLNPAKEQSHKNAAIHHLADYRNLIELLGSESKALLDEKLFPIFMGGDHSMAAGILPSLASRSKDEGREQFVLWLDAHPDIHSLESTDSGNLHGTPIAYSIGRGGFDEFLPKLETPIKSENICMLGIRSVDPAELASLSQEKIEVHDMRAIDEFGIASPLRNFLKRVKASNGHLHVSLDVDFLDPEIAPAVGTTVPGGATFREAHLVMEMLHDSALVSSLDIVELNPFLDERGRTATLIVDLVASLFGRQVLDRQTRSY